MTRFAVEPLTDALWDELLPLMEQHYREIPQSRDVPFNPHKELYMNSASCGTLRVITARDNGTLIGYASFVVMPHPHTQVPQAVSDALYVVPSRRGVVGVRLIDWCEQQLAREGVGALYVGASAATPLGSMLERMGYEMVDVVYTRRLN